MTGPDSHAWCSNSFCWHHLIMWELHTWCLHTWNAFDRSHPLSKLMVIMNSSCEFIQNGTHTAQHQEWKWYWMRLTDTDDQDQDMVRCRVEPSRHFYSNLQKISTLQKILLAIPSGRVSAPYLYSYLELNCNSFTKMNSFVKILSLALEKYFHFHYLE